MDNKFLLTGTINGVKDYVWFEHEYELLEFIARNDVINYEAIEIFNCREVVSEDL